MPTTNDPLELARHDRVHHGEGMRTDMEKGERLSRLEVERRRSGGQMLGWNSQPLFTSLLKLALASQEGIVTEINFITPCYKKWQERDVVTR